MRSLVGRASDPENVAGFIQQGTRRGSDAGGGVRPGRACTAQLRFRRGVAAASAAPHQAGGTRHGRSPSSAPVRPTGALPPPRPVTFSTCADVSTTLKQTLPLHEISPHHPSRVPASQVGPRHTCHVLASCRQSTSANISSNICLRCPQAVPLCVGPTVRQNPVHPLELGWRERDWG